MKNGTPALIGMIFVVLAIVAGLIYMLTVHRGQDESHQVHEPSIILTLGPTP